MSEYLRAQKEAERERGRCRDSWRGGSQPPEVETSPPESLDKLLRLLVEEPVEAESRRWRWREHGRPGLRFMGAAALIIGLIWLLGSSSSARLGRLWQTASTPVTAAVDTSTIPAATDTTRSVVATDEPTVLFRVQVGAFVNSSNAERLAERLRSEGFVVVSRTLYVGTENTTSRTLQAVRVGAYPTARTAEHVRAELARLGYGGFVVRER